MLKRPFFLFLVTLALAPCAGAQNDDDAEIPMPSPAMRLNGETPKSPAAGKNVPRHDGHAAGAEERYARLKLAPARQTLAGLRMQALEAMQWTDETRAYGRVLDIQALLDLRARHRSAESELSIAEAAARLARQNRDRLARLQREAIVATRELMQAEAQLTADQARADAARRHIRETREEALLAWGAELTRLAVEADSPLLENLMDRSSSLLLIVLPAGQSLSPTQTAIRVAPVGDAARARPVRPLSPAPRTEESVQGETWYCVAETGGLRAGMRLDAWLAQDAKAARGVAMPLAAIVWSNGLPWVYVKIGADAFERRPVTGHRERGETWFVSQGFAPSEEVVTVGGQTLLSEELRRLAPAGDDDD
jgi:hypothetical protein